jgi:hypothetical protein
MKLTVKAEIEFSTRPLLITDKDTFEEISLDGKAGALFFKKIPYDELCFEVVSTNEDAEASFPFFLSNGKKGAIFDVALSKEGTSLDVKISGEFSVDLRAGVGKVLQACGSDLDLRVRGVMWKGGSYNGFMASVTGGDFEQERDDWRSSFPRIADFSVK